MPDETPERVPARTAVVLALGALAAAGGHLGPLSTLSTRALAAVALLLVHVVVLAARRDRTALVLGTVLFVAGTALLARVPGADAATLLVVALLAADAWLARDVAPRLARLLEDAAGAGLVLGAFMLLDDRLPRLWLAVDGLTRALTAALGRASGAGTTLGPSVAGVPLVVLALAFLLLRAARGDEGQRPLALVAAAWVALIVAATWALGVPLLLRAVTAIATVGAPTGAPPLPGYPASVAVFLPLALFATLLVPVGLLGAAPLVVYEERPDLRAPVRRRLALLAFGLAFALAVPAERLPGDGRAIRVMIDRGGMTEWKVPSPERLGLERIGMFGQLPRYLRAGGFDVRLEPDALSASALAAADVVVVINPTERPAADALARLETFVANGGGLVVLGDHTDLSGIMGPLNAITGPYGMTYRFDSAFTPAHWHDDTGFLPHPLVRGLDDANNRFQQSTGASLQLAAGAEPVATARWGFSDLGNRDNTNAFLGDYLYQPGEPLGDLPVVATARHGRGRVIAFGDTSMFQNVALPYSFEFVTRTFQCAAAKDVPLLPTLRPLALLLWCALAVLALRGNAAGGFALLSVAGLAAAAFVAPVFEPARTPVAGTRLAVIDAAHFNGVSLDIWEPRGLAGLAANLARNGFVPVLDRSFERSWLERAAVYVSVVPRRAFEPAELQALRGVLDRGGRLVLATGWEEKAPAASLLALTGLDIEPVPLGPVPVLRKISDNEVFKLLQDQPHFAKAWALSGARDGDDVLYASDGYPIVVQRRVGNGQAIVIADPLFLVNRTLEQEGAAWPGNIAFLARVFGGAAPVAEGARP